MSTLQDLLARKAALEQEIESTQKRERSDAIAKVKALMTEYGLSAADLTAKSGTRAGARIGAPGAAQPAPPVRVPASGTSPA